MGRRGPGAKPLPKPGVDAPKLRTRFPWRRKGLSTADAVISFLNWLPITSGAHAGRKFKCRPWQEDFIRATFAENADGTRPVRKSVFSLPRKCGKSQLAAGLCAAALFGPLSIPRGQVVSGATTRQQAALIFDELEALIDAVPEFAARVNVQRFLKVITVLDGDGKGSVYKALSSDAKSAHGLSPHFAVVDEFGQSPDDELYQALATSQGAHANPCLLVISTEAAEDVAPMSQLIDYGKRVMAGDVEDPAFHLTHYGASETDDPYDPKTWYTAIPALGDFRDFRDFTDVENQARAAKESPSQEPAFLNLTLNLRVASEARFLSPVEWRACGEEPYKTAGRVAYGGLDLSWNRDLTALVFVVPDGNSYDVECQFFLPENGILQKSQQDRVPWKLWADQGWLTLTPGKSVDPAFVAHAIKKAQGHYDLRSIGFDRWGIENLRRELEKIGYEEALQPIGQGFQSMSPACDLVDRAVADSRLRHGMNPILTMCAANAVTVADPTGARKLHKPKSAGKIDGIQALAMAMVAAETHSEDELPACLARYL